MVGKAGLPITTWTSVAPAFFNNFTTDADVVPRTIESSIRTTCLPFTTLRCRELHPEPCSQFLCWLTRSVAGWFLTAHFICRPDSSATCAALLVSSRHRSISCFMLNCQPEPLFTLMSCTDIDPWILESSASRYTPLVKQLIKSRGSCRGDAVINDDHDLPGFTSWIHLLQPLQKAQVSEENYDESITSFSQSKEDGNHLDPRPQSAYSPAWEGKQIHSSPYSRLLSP